MSPASPAKKDCLLELKFLAKLIQQLRERELISVVERLVVMIVDCLTPLHSAAVLEYKKSD